MSGKHEMAKENRNERKVKEGERKPKNNKTKERKSRKGLKIFGTIVLTLVIIFVILVGIIVAFITSKLGKMQQVMLDEADLGIS